MTMTFYTNPNSRGRMVRWMLEEIGCAYETVIRITSRAVRLTVGAVLRWQCQRWPMLMIGVSAFFSRREPDGKDPGPGA